MMRYLLVLVSGMVAVMLLYNLENYLASPEPTRATQDYAAIDYYLTGFSLSAVNAAGSLSHTVDGQYLAYSEDRKSSFIVKPRIASKDTASQQPADAVTLTAEEATFDHKDNTARLNGNVRLHVANAGMSQMDLQTAFLTYRLADHHVSTDQPVSITSPQLVLQGTGLDAKLDEAYLRLNSNVKSIYQPKP